MTQPTSSTAGGKTCKDCGETKPYAAFSRQKGYKDGHRSNCKACVVVRAEQWRVRNFEHRLAYSRAYYQANADRIKAASRRSALRRRYGITGQQYDAMYALQRGRCAVCGGQGTALVVDHCHSSGAVRGLLCDSCNVGIGSFRDNSTLIAAAIQYLSASSV